MYALFTPRNCLIVAPQVFQGKKFDVMVPQSSRHLDRFFGASLLSSKASLNILPGSTRARYWSQHTAFTTRQVISVARTSPPVPLATLSSVPAREAIIPVASITPPKHMAQIMMDMVHMNPCMPLAVSRPDSSLIMSEAPSGTLPMAIPLLRM